MTINQMFAAAVTTKSIHPGYMVLIRDRKGNEQEQGPYSLPIARLVKEEYSAFTTFLMDMQTGELL